MPSYKAREGVELTPQEVAALIEPFAAKFWWFKEQGYAPHYWQTLFHTMKRDLQLCRFRHLVAGRRGGKTLSAAWELLFYLMFPAQFHADAHGTESDRPLVAWVLTKDYPAGLPALMTFREVLKQAGLEHGVEFKENKGNRWFEFANGSWLFFKTADDPDSLRGAGLDILWMDEAAFIPSPDAYNVVSPGLGDKLGLVWATTTPSGKNWFYEEFWSDAVMDDPDIGRVEYWSIDNPYFAKSEWERFKRTYHPAMFKQEFCASFDSMAGRALHGDWLHYYAEQANPAEDVIALPRNEAGRLKPLRMWMGVDPAISLSDSADYFSMALIGITEDNSQAFLLDVYRGKIPFPEQLDMIQLWANKYRPGVIGIEAVAYQAALAQQAMRLPGLPNVIPIFAKGKKVDRILSMAPYFRTGRIRIRKTQTAFINEWIDYDPEIKNPHDDTLDAVEIALRTAGVLLPDTNVVPSIQQLFDLEDPSLEAARARDFKPRRRGGHLDLTMGEDW